MNPEVLYIVIPCFNEQAVLPISSKILKTKLDDLKAKGAISIDSRILFVNNCSTDNTFSFIETISNQYPDYFTGISLSANCGQQNALLAGLETAVKYADIMITMDADLQDDPEAIDEMVEKHKAGADIVFGVRSSRKRDSFFKKTTANLFYRLSNYLEMGLIPNHAEFRLMNKRSVMALCNYKESELFLRGIVTRIGFSTDTVYFERKERKAGKSNYSKKDLMELAVSAITSLSTKPLRLIFALGFLDMIAGIVLFVLFLSLFRDSIGYFIVSLLLWLAGTNKFAVGLIAEYIGKIYMEVKARPRYFITCNLLDE